MTRAEFSNAATASAAINYIDRRADGYYRVARRRLIDYRPSPDQPARMVLPLEPQVGRYWQHPTATYLLKRILPFPTRYRYGRPIEMVFHVAATGLNVTVPAGSYDGCVRVDGEARIQVASDPRQGLSSVPISQREWYCPAVGLVRLTRQEKLYSEQATVVGGRLEMELIRLDNGRSWAALWRRLKSWL